MKLGGMQKRQTIFVSKYMGQNKQVYALFGPLASPRRYANFPGMFTTLCLAKVSPLSQTFFNHWHDSVQESWFDHRLGSFPTCQHAQNCKTALAWSIFCRENKRKSDSSLRGWWGTTPQLVFLPFNEICPLL
jgi:hypothetical protein